MGGFRSSGAGGKPKQHNNQVDQTDLTSYMKITYKTSVVTPALMGALFLTTGYLCEAQQTTVHGPSTITLSNAGAPVAGTWQMSWTNKCKYALRHQLDDREGNDRL